MKSVSILDPCLRNHVFGEVTNELFSVGFVIISKLEAALFLIVWLMYIVDLPRFPKLQSEKKASPTDLPKMNLVTRDRWLYE